MDHRPTKTERTESVDSDPVRRRVQRRLHAVSVLLSGVFLSMVVCYTLRTLSQPFPALFPNTLAGILVSGVVVAAVAVGYAVTRRLRSTFVMALLPVATANYSDRQCHVDGVIDTPGDRIVSESLTTTTIYWGIGLLVWGVSARFMARYRS